MTTRAGISKTDMIVAMVVFAAVAVGAVLVVKMDKTGKTGSGLGESFSYDLTGLARIDPDRILYARVGSLDTKMKSARSIAFGPGGKLYVAGDSGIRVYEKPPAVDPASHFAVAPAYGLAVAADGTMYVARGNFVSVHGPDGAEKATWPVLDPDALLTSIVLMDGNVYVADAANGVVVRCGLDGKILGRIGRKDKERNIPGISGLNKNLDLSSAPDGLLRVANTGRLSVEAYTPGGDLQQSFGKAGGALEDFCGCCNPVNIAVLPDGNVVTVEKGQGHRRAKVYTADGEFIGAVAAPEAFPNRHGALPSGQGGGPTPVLDVAVDEAGTIWVLDTNTGIVRAFDRKQESQ